MRKLAELEDDDGSLSMEYGINLQSCLLDLKYFDVCGGGLLPDIMHDVLEGALQYELKLLLQYCIKDKRFFQVLIDIVMNVSVFNFSHVFTATEFLQLSALNEMIENNELGHMESDRPAPITAKTLSSKDKCLKQKGI